jgi:predicted NUDIX family NTP pyrophosphohydrolase
MARTPPAHSAGVLLYRRIRGALEVLLIHPGGPFWRNKNIGAWQLAKGGLEAGESPVEAARRETEEELGIVLTGTPEPLCQLRQAGGKLVDVFALEQDLDPSAIAGNRFELEWPPKSGRMQSFPEVDKAAWFTLDEARNMILESQLPMLEAIASRAGAAGSSGRS